MKGFQLAGRFFDVFTDALLLAFGSPLTTMTVIWRNLYWYFFPNIAKLDKIFPFTYEEQIEKYQGRFSSRTIHIDAEWFRKAVKCRYSTELYTGSDGEIVKYDDKSRFPVVIKKHSYGNDKNGKEISNWREIKISSVNEILAGSLRHYAIVPLIAIADDFDNRINYLMFPLMEKQDLRRFIDEDNERITKNQALQLTDRYRLMILTQVACGMAYIHKENNVRGAVSHGDLTTTNILLDEHFCARISDFGESREYASGQSGVENLSGKNPVGTPGYYDEDRRDYMNTETDIRYFGIVILEMLTGRSPKYGARFPLLTDLINTIAEENKDQMQAVWKDDETQTELLGLASRCRPRITQAVDIDAAGIKEKLKAVSRRGGIDFPTRPKSEICQSCLVTKTVEDNIEIGCNRLQICINCIRNSHLNPMECHACRKETASPIGHKWGAVLIPGYDVNDKYRKLFEQDIKKISDVVTAKHSRPIGIRKENVMVARKKSELDGKVQLLQDRAVTTVFVYYSGHFTKEVGFHLEGDEYLQDIELANTIRQSGCSKVQYIFDCCDGPNATREAAIPSIQLTACIPDQYITIIERNKCTIFTSYIVQAMQGKCCMPTEDNANCEICDKFKSLDGYISIEHLRTYISRHFLKRNEMNNGMYGKVEPSTLHSMHGRDKDFKIAFESVLPKETTFKMKVNDDLVVPFALDELPCEEELLRDYLLQKIQAEGEMLTLPTVYSEVLQLNTVYSDLKCLELRTHEQIENALGRGMDIFVQMRGMKHIHNGKVGVIRAEEDAHTLFENLKALRGNENIYTLFEANPMVRLEPSTITVDLKKDGLWRMARFAKEHDVGPVPLHQYLETIKNSNINKKEGALVLTFPVEAQDDIGTVLMNRSFFTIHWENQR